MPQTIKLPRGMRAAELSPTSFSETDSTIDCIWTTGATVRRMSWEDGPVDEELRVTPNAVRMATLNEGAPLLNGHRASDCANVLGCVVPGSARLEGGRGVARVKLSQMPDVAGIVGRIREGVIRNVSVGYVRHRIDKVVRSNDVPLYRVVDWEPIEISAVPIPFDVGAQFRAADADRQEWDCILTGVSSAELARLRLQLARRRRLAA